MPHGLLRQTTTAVIRDFDKTRIPGYMETPIFRHFDVDGDRFWREVDGRPAFYRGRGLEIVSRDSLYLSHMPPYVRHGLFRGLNSALQRELGAALVFHPGPPGSSHRSGTSLRAVPSTPTWRSAGPLHRRQRPQADDPRQPDRSARARGVGQRVRRRPRPAGRPRRGRAGGAVRVRARGAGDRRRRVRPRQHDEDARDLQVNKAATASRRPTSTRRSGGKTGGSRSAA